MAGKKADRARGPAGTLLRRAHKDGPQVVETTGRRWSDAAERRFLDTLGASCNVSLSARAAGFAATGIYARRLREPAFAAAWAAALDQGYLRLETALVRAAADTVEGLAPDPDTPFPAMSVREAMDVLRHHRGTVKGDARRHGGIARPRSLEELRDSILTKFEAIEAVRLYREAGDAG